jgi:hypothetical protein
MAMVTPDEWWFLRRLAGVSRPARRCLHQLRFVQHVTLPMSPDSGHRYFPSQAKKIALER